ncbi:MAG: hypothetical protein V1822_04230 [Candidatus Micrarchaeota archaeon]
MEVNIKYISYAALGLCLLGALGSFISGGGPLAPIAALLAFLGGVAAVAVFKYGYFIIPFLTQKGKIIQIMEGGYEIPPAQDVIIKNVGGTYYASAYLGVKIYESTTEKSQEENVVYSEYFERAISSVRFPVKFAMMVYVMDMSRHRTKLETKHAEAQLRLAREREKPDPDVLKLDRYEKEVSMYEMQIHRLVSGFKPMGAITYLMTTALGLSKEAATAAAKTQANELRATISNALNVQVVPLQGDEMLRCFEWEHIIPPSASSMEEAVL